MKILFLTNHLDGDDGWSRYSVDIAQEIQSQGNEVLCLTSKRSNQNQIREIVVLREPLKYLANPIASFLVSSEITKIIQKFSPNVIHFLVEPYSTILPFLRTVSIKIFITIHGTYSYMPNTLDNNFKKIISGYFTKKIYKKINGIISVSEYTKNYLLNYLPEIEFKLKVITNGIDLIKHKIIDLHNKPQNKIKQMLFVGAIKQRKGIIEAIKALEYYKNNFSDNFIYNIVGEYSPNGSYYQGLLKKIKDYNLENKIFFREKVTDEELENYYLNADLFLMPAINIANHFEGFGLVYLEANAKGVPCIGSKDYGAQEAILDGKTGYVVNPHNFKEIAEKIDFVLNKNAISGQDCIEWAKKNDIKIKVKDLINFYQASKNV